MKKLLQMTLTFFLIFVTENYGFALQEPLRENKVPKSWKSWLTRRLHSQEEKDKDSDHSQEIIDSDFLSEDNSSTRHSSQSNEQIFDRMDTIEILDDVRVTQEFKKLQNELIPTQKSCFSCLFGCRRKSYKKNSPHE